MVFLENDTFLLELTRMFQKSKSIGTGQVSVVMKKYDGKDRPTPSLKPKKTKKGKGKEAAPAPPPPKPRTHSGDHHSCLMRAKLHNRKISTVVHSKDVNRFQLAYCNLLKGNMDNLKKLKKVKSKTSKATA